MDGAVSFATLFHLEPYPPAYGYRVPSPSHTNPHMPYSLNPTFWTIKELTHGDTSSSKHSRVESSLKLALRSQSQRAGERNEEMYPQ
ncbi:hypothetical protein PoB_005699600 [Plakobranchus ocellatus]|uniref:Uncharacterized protein n=1 Tax=Plakobranchus ocellatus TaxID=259542 RepID=A0AAV4C596_9GAST|nr:hypothetical protein PoB_005699600 [Plakobranchus ocellatus]